MEKLDFTLLSDGDSDQCLLPILKWLLRRFFANTPINGQWADLSRLWNPPKTLSERICKAIEFYQPDLLFIHRDAEAQDPLMRFGEISKAVSELKENRLRISFPYVCVVPIRMTETWLLFDENAIRKAAGNPNGKVPIDLPTITSLETIPRPKEVLYSLLINASELHGRKMKKFKPEKCRYLITEYINDFSPLLALQAFRRLNEDIGCFSSSNVQQ